MQNRNRRFGLAALLIALSLLASPRVLAAGAEAPFVPLPLPPTMGGSGNAVVLPDITQRMPGQGNDYAHGYPACGNGSYATCFWRYGQRIYQQGNAEAGTPQWAVVNPYGTPLPGNAASASVYGAWSCSALLVSGWSGNLCQLTRSSDSTTLAVGVANGVLNLAALQAFCANTTCGVSIAYDQSGNGNNCAQATQADMPVIVVDASGTIRLSFPEFTGTTQNTAVSLSCSGVSLTKNSLTAAVVAARRGQMNNTGVSIIDIGNSYQLVDYYQGGITTFGDGGFGSGAFSGVLNARGSVVIGASGSSTRTVTTDGYAPYSKSAFGGTALSGMTIGMTPGSAPSGAIEGGNIEYYGWLVYASQLSNADQQAVRVAADDLFNLVPQARTMVAIAGESVWHGWEQDAGQGVTDRLREMLPTSAVIVDQAWSGQTDAQMASNYTDQLSWLCSAQYPANALLFNPGLNGINGGETVAQVESNIASFIASAKATGCWNTIAVMTEISRTGSNSGGSYAAQGQAISAYIRGLSGIVVVDLQADPLLGATGAYANSAIFHSNDQTHLTNAGMAEAAAIAANALISQGALSY
jgi:hypothetical protein